jgi:hypothetical protein
MYTVNVISDSRVFEVQSDDVGSPFPDIHAHSLVQDSTCKTVSQREPTRANKSNTAHNAQRNGKRTLSTCTPQPTQPTPEDTTPKPITTSQPPQTTLYLPATTGLLLSPSSAAIVPSFNNLTNSAIESSTIIFVGPSTRIYSFGNSPSSGPLGGG